MTGTTSLVVHGPKVRMESLPLVGAISVPPRVMRSRGDGLSAAQELEHLVWSSRNPGRIDENIADDL